MSEQFKKYEWTTKAEPKIGLVIEVALPDDDTPVDALKRAERALADEGLNVTGFFCSTVSLGY